jgi:SAM-dependent methyltransferase
VRILKRRWLEHTSTRGLDLDDPATTARRHELIRGKTALRKVYDEWYRLLAEALPGEPGLVLELGSGGGYLSEVVPGLARSDLFPYPWIDLALDAHALPFRSASLRGIVMVNVLHHLAHPSRFFEEAARCVRPGGVVAMIEPWNTPWSGFVYRRFHHVPFEPRAEDWSAPSGGPLSGANGALPWIVFSRDRDRFRRDHLMWEVRRAEPVMPLSYLLTGGVSLRALAPAAVVALSIRAEKAMRWFARRQGMFASIVLERRTDAP